jgi:predicted GNAT family acetyltransferase
MIETVSVPLTSWRDWCALSRNVKIGIQNVSGPGPGHFDDSGDFWLTIAMAGDQPVGAHLYVIDGKTIWSWSTWVHHWWNGRGIAKTLWRAGLDLQEATRVRVGCCSNGGWALIQSLRIEFKGRVQFSVADLRDSMEVDRFKKAA